MQIDLDDIEEGAALSCDLCIIGAGIAGITLARQFIGSGTTLCLLESGGSDFEAATQALYQGENVGTEYYPLDDARLRFFGGSTLVWGGRSVPLDPLDFETRPWVPFSGWPLSRSDLDPYYRRAHALFEIGPFLYDDRLWSEIGDTPPAFSEKILRTTFWQIDEADARFGWKNCQDVIRAANITLINHANATNLQAHPDGNAVESIALQSLSGKRAQLKARAYVLATGGIENPRILLASNGVQSAGLGNQNDLVGRFFMEHPHGRVAEIFASDPYPLLAMYRKRRTRSGLLVAPVLSPSDELQSSAGILNSSVTIKYRRSADQGEPLGKQLYKVVKHASNPTSTGRGVWKIYKRINALAHRVGDPWVRRAGLALGSHRLYLSVRGEQAPNPDSRVVLSQEKDALGVPRANLDWQMSELDKRSVAVLVDRVGEELERLQLGRVAPSEWLSTDERAWPNDPSVGTHPIGGYHHMGTTRMADDPKQGVVDADCRVHGLTNLYVAGSSVFPTGGWANPNLTISALALRLGDHLEKAIARL